MTKSIPESGQISHQSAEGAVGTLGPVMKSDNNVLTARHVLPEGDRALIVDNEEGKLEACLHAAERSLRIQGRPRARVEDGDQVGFQDGVILLGINGQNKDKSNTVSY